jgi:hypothetical protein
MTLDWQWLLDTTPKAQSIKERVEKLDLIKTALWETVSKEWKASHRFGDNIFKRSSNIW